MTDPALDPVPRPEVRAFALLMERQLRANDHKPGWKQDTPESLLNRAREEVEELATVAGEGNPEVGREAADVANMAMMVADVCGALDPLSALDPTLSYPMASPAWYEANIRQLVVRADSAEAALAAERERADAQQMEAEEANDVAADLAQRLAAERERSERYARALERIVRGEEEAPVGMSNPAAVARTALEGAEDAALTDPQVPQAAPESGTEGERATPDLGDGA